MLLKSLAKNLLPLGEYEFWLYQSDQLSLQEADLRALQAQIILWIVKSDTHTDAFL